MHADLPGQYAIGKTKGFLRGNEDLGELAIWYPAASSPRFGDAAYAAPEEAAVIAKMLKNLPSEWVEKLRCRSTTDAPIASTRNGFPLLFFFHGWAGLPVLSQTLIETLVSHGYVVIGHINADCSLIAKKHCGTYEISLQDLPPQLDERMAFFDAKADAWLEMANRLVESIAASPEELPGQYDWRSAIALDRLGAFGFSFGGSTAISLATHNTRIAAAANIDGTLCGTYGTRSRDIPLLLLSHKLTEESGDPASLAIHAERETAFWNQAAPGTKQIVIDGARHRSFSDISLVAQESYQQNGFGTLSVRECLDICGSALPAFFNAALQPGNAAWSMPDSAAITTRTK